MSKTTAFGFVLLISCFYFIPTEAPLGLGRLFGKKKTRQTTFQEEEPQPSEEPQSSEEPEQHVSWTARDYGHIPISNEESDRSDRGYGTFNLEVGKRKIITILSNIEKYLSGRVNTTAVSNATDVDGLISAANHSLTNEQDEELTGLGYSERSNLTGMIAYFINDISGDLNNAGYGDAISEAPLWYLYNRLDKSLKNSGDDED